MDASMPKLWPRARTIWEKGTNRCDFLSGAVDKYMWVDKGSSFLMGELTAAMLAAQLEGVNDITSRRLARWHQYHRSLEGLETKGWLRRPIVAKGCLHNAHLYHVLIWDQEAFAAVSIALNNAGVQAARHYPPLHLSPGGLQFGRASGECHVTESVARTLLRLPLWPGMPASDVDVVTGIIERTLAKRCDDMALPS